MYMHAYIYVLIQARYHCYTAPIGFRDPEHMGIDTKMKLLCGQTPHSTDSLPSLLTLQPDTGTIFITWPNHVTEQLADELFYHCGLDPAYFPCNSVNSEEYYSIRWFK
jgi:hypothetical protein